VRGNQFAYGADVLAGDYPASIREFRHQQQYESADSGTQGENGFRADLL
jgi:hypothetical protein